MPKQKRNVNNEQLILTGQFIRLAQRLGRTDLEPVQQNPTARTALTQLRSAIQVAQNAIDLLLRETDSAKEMHWPAPANGTHTHKLESPIPRHNELPRDRTGNVVSEF